MHQKQFFYSKWDENHQVPHPDFEHLFMDSRMIPVKKSTSPLSMSMEHFWCQI
jgi:hypothetical protein